MKLVKKCRQCRTEGKKLFLKGTRCDLPKCSFTRRSYGPGKKQKTMIRRSDFGKQLRAKQAAKRIYGLSEKQLKNYYQKASKTKTATGEHLLQLLERRLDNVIFRLGFAPSRVSARQIVGHGKIMINEKKADIPSISVKAKDKIAISKKSALKSSKKPQEIPIWLKFDAIKQSAEIIKLPTLKELETEDIDRELIVEFYSR